MSELSRSEEKFEKAFLKALSKSLRVHGVNARSLLSAIRTTARRELFSYQIDLSEPVSRANHLAACLVLHSDHVLQNDLPDQHNRLEVIKGALLQPGSRAVKVFTWLMLTFSRDSFAALRAYALERIPVQHGETFTFETTQDTENVFVQSVTRCFYHRFFIDAAAPHLTQLFCAYDRLWIDQIKPGRDKVRFERPQTLAEGAPSCRFEFNRISAPTR